MPHLSFMVFVFFIGLFTPAWAPAVPDPAREQWADAQQIAQEYRPMLYGDSVRLTDSLAYEIVRAADRYQVERRMGFQLVMVESRFKVTALSHKGARGLTQVMPNTGRRVCNLSPQELYDPLANLDCGFRYYSQLLGRYEGNHWFALTAYYRGPRKADSLKAQGLGYPESIL